MPLAHLSIGTATSRIDLLDPRGYHAGEWKPKAGDTDDTFASSALADYRQLTSYRETTTVETIPLTLWQGSQDATIRQTQDLRRTLRAARDYWLLPSSSAPVYLAARASCETNTRYAIVHAGEVPEDGNPYGEPFLQAGKRAVMLQTLVLERGPWLETAPGATTAVEISAVEAYDGRNLGNVDSSGVRSATTAADTVYIANKHNEANLTDVWFWDETAGAWNAANLMAAALPYAFLPAVPAVDDLALFGIDTSLDDSGPFCSLVFDIGTAIGVGAGITIQWRYKGAGDTDDPASWTELVVQDNTNAGGAETGDAFDTVGINSVHWIQPSDWATSNPNPGAALGITGYWVAAYITAAAGATTPPQQRNRDIYTVTWAYVEVDAAQVPGDIDAWLRALLHCQSDDVGLTAPALYYNQAIVGLRSLDRGSSFRAYINAGAYATHDQNATGITSAAAGAGAFAARANAPVGYVLRATNPGAAWATVWSIYIFSTSDQYYGVYHAYLRAEMTSGATGDLRVRYVTSVSEGATDATTYTSDAVTVPARTSAGVFNTINLGRLELPPAGGILDTEESVLRIEIQLYGNGAADLDIADLIIIPTDEWAAHLTGTSTTARVSAIEYHKYLNMDSIANPKVTVRALRQDSTLITAAWSPAANGPAILRHNRDQRLWFFFPETAQSGGVLESRFEVANSAQLWRQARYLSMRGDR